MYTIVAYFVEMTSRPIGALDSLRVPRPDPPLLPSIIFPLGPPFCGDECRAERALGCGGIFPRDQQAGARVRKRRREGNEWAARVERRYTIQRTIRWLKNRCQVGPQFSSSAPPRSPAPPFDHFPFGPRHSAATSAERNVRSEIGRASCRERVES